jgi:hypothetical protein
MSKRVDECIYAFIIESGLYNENKKKLISEKLLEGEGSVMSASSNSTIFSTIRMIFIFLACI